MYMYNMLLSLLMVQESPWKTCRCLSSHIFRSIHTCHRHGSTWRIISEGRAAGRSICMHVCFRYVIN
ncbi:hypothetical protein GQ55_1G448000 [Panicum hallii var. hallii]|uniref:Uncharacterized protein n=1 Tax=Panicum hallii var. hallii TaxID=1504633 RepID=A0A2T7FE76_9POAL|nr:hypothetical protein GQ55_1G448000 [Panicum hallii var. hallii]